MHEVEEARWMVAFMLKLLACITLRVLLMQRKIANICKKNIFFYSLLLQLSGIMALCTYHAKRKEKKD